jgi:[acyl-carrier-protein] S-malonyltransferase
MGHAKLRAMVLCPGRGSYGRDQLGSLQGRGSATLATFEEIRAAAGRPSLVTLDGASRFSPRQHIAGEHASLLTAACSLADAEEIDPARVELVGVMGNSMGWYTALGLSGALGIRDCGHLIETMGSWQADNVIGGQVVVPLTGEDWVPDPRRESVIEAVIQRVPGLYWSIRLGGQAVLAGSDEALARALAELPGEERGGIQYPLRLPLHSAFHTPWMGATAERATRELWELGWRSPKVPLIDGRGMVYAAGWGDPGELREWTLGAQIAETYDFTRMVAVGLGEFAPDVVILPGPGSNLGSAVAQVMIRLGWRGIRSRADFMAIQKENPVVIAMGRPEQRALVAG